MAFLGVSSCLCAQGTGSATPPDTAVTVPQTEIPDAPAPHIELAMAADPLTVDPQSGQAQNTQPPATGTTSAPAASGGTAQSTSSSQAQQPDAQATRREKGEQEVKEEEHQRVLGIAPNFNETYRHDAVSLTAVQKLNLAYHSSIDPFTFAAGFLVAGFHEALDEDPGFGWGPEGYFKRSGAAYLDAVDGNMIGNAFLPIILHQDPRYFRLGPGPTIKHRILYSVATNFICKGDNGHWQPNISNVGGNIIAGALSNYYYPAQNSGWGQTIGNGMIVTTEGAFGSLFDEFWPDISRKFLHRDPTRGLDALQANDHKGGANSDKPIQK
jgi:hypothetical protein